MALTCKYCNEPLKEEWDECPACGRPTVETVCPKCGTELKPHWLKCPGCKTLTQSRQTASGPVTAPSPTPSVTRATPGSGQVVYSSAVPGSGTGSMFEAAPEVQSIDFEKGTEVGRYCIVKKLGQGSYGAVFEVTDSRLAGRKLALKVMPFFNNESFESIVREFNAREEITEMNHVLRAYEPDQVEVMGQSYVIYPLELAEEGSLREMLPKLREIEDPKEKEKQILHLFGQMCKGVEACHKAGIVHLDIKPENFLFRGGRLQVTDFGISRKLQEQDVDVGNLQEGRGSGPYMAPEQHETANPLDVDARADVYALGVVLYEMFSGGKRPYEGRDLNKKKRNYAPKEIEGLADTIWQAIEKSLKPEYKERYRTVEELLNAVMSGVRQEEERKKAQAAEEKRKREEEEEKRRKAAEAAEKRRLKEEEKKRKAEAERERKEREAAEAERRRLKEEKARLERELAAAREAEEARRRAEEEARRRRTEQPEELELDCASGVKLKMKLIPAGEFMMGDEEEGDASEHKVIIKKPFYMGIYPVTQEQYEAVMGRNPSEFKGARRPVESVTWQDAVDFCEELSSDSGLKVRLPSEAEWEYACRAGSMGAYCFGDGESRLDLYAWYGDNSNSETLEVGQKKANSWGLYDMHGNVWEWCRDQWSSNYQGVPTDGSAWEGGDDSDGSRVNRGGSWFNFARFCRSAYRSYCSPGNSNYDLGFRVAVSPV